MMEVIKTRHIGFCFGVNRAVSRVLKEAENRKEKIYTLGPLLHNPQTVEMLREKGIEPIDDVARLERGVVAFRSHGIMKEEEEYIRAKGLEAIDTTCPFVKRVRMAALYLRKNGYKVVIAGDERHPEVKSVLSYLGKRWYRIARFVLYRSQKDRRSKPDHIRPGDVLGGSEIAGG